MKLLKRIITGVTLTVALMGYALVEGSLISYANVNGFEMEIAVSERPAESRACVALSDNPMQVNDCRNKKRIPSDNNSSERGRSNLNNSGSLYLTDMNQGLRQGLSRVDWSQGVASAVLNSQGDARVLSKVGLESGPNGQSNHHEQAESDSIAENKISGSLLVSILALIAIVAVARRNVSEPSD
jgi:hypothetical protein